MPIQRKTNKLIVLWMMLGVKYVETFWSFLLFRRWERLPLSLTTDKKRNAEQEHR